jgi:hypothetical protein
LAAMTLSLSAEAAVAVVVTAPKISGLIVAARRRFPPVRLSAVTDSTDNRCSSSLINLSYRTRFEFSCEPSSLGDTRWFVYRLLEQCWLFSPRARYHILELWWSQPRYVLARLGHDPEVDPWVLVVRPCECRLARIL